MPSHRRSRPEYRVPSHGTQRPLGEFLFLVDDRLVHRVSNEFAIFPTQSIYNKIVAKCVVSDPADLDTFVVIAEEDVEEVLRRLLEICCILFVHQSDPAFAIEH